MEHSIFSYAIYEVSSTSEIAIAVSGLGNAYAITGPIAILLMLVVGAIVFKVSDYLVELILNTDRNEKN